MKTPKSRNNGQWTEARFRSFIKSALRKASMRWGPINLTKKEAWVERGKYLCAECKQVVPLTLDGKKNVFVDHVNPVVDPEEGFVSWDKYIERMFCEKDNLSVLCGDCHIRVKSKGEEETRKSIQFYRKNFNTTYQTWANMNQRCLNPNATGYEHYGGKGISVCERWAQGNGISGIENFIEDMGYRPDGTTLDRKDYNKGYNKDNCRWATAVEQARNTSINNWIDYRGESYILEEWGEKTGISPNTILTRLRRGWSVGQALGKEEKTKPDYTGRLTPDDFEYMIKRTLEGDSQTKIAEDLEVDSSCVSRHLDRLGVKQPKPITNAKLSESEKLELITKRASGFKVKELSDLYSVSESTVYNVIRQHK